MQVVDAVVSSPNMHIIELRNVSVIPQSFMLSHTVNSLFYCVKKLELRSVLTGFTFKKIKRCCMSYSASIAFNDSNAPLTPDIR